MPMRYRLTLFMLLVLLAAGIFVGLSVGRGVTEDMAVRAIFFELRAVRCGAAALAGAALAVAGVLMQGLFRNPLASPSILGTTAGAAVGGQLVLMMFGSFAALLPTWFVPEMLLPMGCLIGAVLSLVALLLVAGRGRDVTFILLAGVVMTALFGSVSAFMTVLSQDSWALGRAVVAFSLGSLDGKGIRHLYLAAPLVITGIGAAWCWGRSLDVMLSGDEEAAALGVDVPRLVRWVLIWSAALTAAAVSVGGGVAFVGLIVPHALRPFTGFEHRRLIPAAALGGAAFLVWCDIAARMIPMRGELPLGVITGLVGAPVFLYILIRTRREGTW